MSMKIARIAHTAKVRAVNDDNRTIDVVASTPSVDSHGTRIDQSGWVLDDFRKNPVITWAHDDRGFTASGGRPIAKAVPETIRVEDDKLKMRLQFPKTGVFKFADEVFGLMRDGFLNAVSVGFEPLKREIIEEDESEDGEQEVWYRRQRLLEVAVVTIPSNSEALAERAVKLNRSTDEVKERLEKIEKMAEELDDDEKEEVETEVEEEVIEEAAEDVEKYRNYFEKKQPANKESGKVLKKFYERVMGEKPPADEVEAWKRMSDVLENVEESEEEVETVETEITAEEPTEETIETTEPVEAPQEEQKASAPIPLDVLLSLPQKLTRFYIEAAVEASLRGIPVEKLGDIPPSLAKQLKEGITKSLSQSL